MAKPYPRQHSTTWYLSHTPYRIFMLREWSAVFVALYVVLLIVLVDRVHEGEAAYDAYVAGVLQHPLMIVLHGVMLAFALLHTATWFRAMPQGMRIKRGEEFVPPMLVIGGAYAALAAVSIVFALVFLL